MMGTEGVELGFILGKRVALQQQGGKEYSEINLSNSLEMSLGIEGSYLIACLR